MISELLELEQENAELKAENFRLRRRIAAYTDAIDRMRLNLTAKEEECGIGAKTNQTHSSQPSQ